MKTATTLVLSIIALVYSVQGGVPVNVMAPLDTVNEDGYLSNPDGLRAALQTLKDAGVNGVMADVWWGVVEKQPGVYNFDGYIALGEMLTELGLEWQVVMSFHQCGGNVGDTVFYPIPGWVREVGSSYDNLWYIDSHGNKDEEYISLFADNDAVLPDGRSPLDAYEDFMRAFAEACGKFDVLHEIQVGAGPAGELRYPSYQEAYWTYPGVGEFQVYSQAALDSLAAAAEGAGHPEWASPPSDAGDYNSNPHSVQFFIDGFASDYGKFFLTWYSDELIAHGDRVLARAERAFGDLDLVLAMKVAGIHWWFYSDSHGAELTAGYYNTRDHNGYEGIAQMFGSHGAIFDFTCLEMTDASQAGCNCESGPEPLVNQVLVTTADVGVKLAGENALPCDGDRAKYNQIVHQARRTGDIEALTYLRLGDGLLGTMDSFTEFVANMAA